jgi:hypothetical protein
VIFSLNSLKTRPVYKIFEEFNLTVNSILLDQDCYVIKILTYAYKQLLTSPPLKRGI